MKVRRPFSTRTAGCLAPLNRYTVESLNRNSASHRRSPDSTLQRSNAPTLPYVSRFTFYGSSHVSRFTFQDARSSRSTIQPFNDSTLRQRGIALVITLILLAVITFMAITFLVVSNAGRQNVNISTEQIAARSMLDAGLEQANASLIAGMIAYTNPTLSLMVSTNYDTHAFVKGNGYFTNVSYTYGNGQPLTPRDNLQNLNNMLYLPRVPVFITNALYRSNSFPFYLDLNRNGRYDTNGWQPVLNTNGGYYDLTGKPTTIFNPTNVLMANMPGDPEWVGVFERGFYNPVQLLGAGRPPTGNFLPGFGHSPTNHAIGRYAYVVIPVSSTLDLNNIYNYGKDLDTANMQVGTDSYLRNQGAGSWELNLAAFLADLNTNYWPSPYNYLGMDLLKANGGVAFEDALALLRYRYAGTVKPGLSPAGIYPLDVLVDNNRIGGLSKDGIDLFASGPLMTNFWPITERDGSRISGRVGFPGSDSTNRWWDPQDLFDPAKTKLNINTNPLGVCDRLYLAGLQKDSYNSGTFYRLLSQMGFDSAPESPKLNLNYANVDAKGNIVPDMVTNLSPWDPAQFFTNAVVRLLTNTFIDPIPTNPAYITNYVVNNHLQIMIWPTNHYTPAVHRLLQLAANIYDATTNRGPTNSVASGFPTVFQPLFFDAGARGANSGVFITGYREVTNLDIINPGTAPTFYDLEQTNSRPFRGNYMFYGIPLVIGAKKGFPNFNEFALQSDLIATRKLEFHRPAINTAIFRTNQTYALGISNSFGVEAWNSYGTPFQRPSGIDLIVAADVICSVTNASGVVSGINGAPLSGTFSVGTVTNIANWPAYVSGRSTPSFRVPLSTNYYFLTNSDYAFSQNRFLPAGIIPSDAANLFPIPQWYANLRTRLRVIMVDRTANRIIDYVNLASTEPTINLAEHLNHNEDGTPANCTGGFSGIGSVFCTNRLQGSASPGTMTYGMLNQILVSEGTYQVDDRYWADFPKTANKADEILKFNNYIQEIDKSQKDFAAPFTPRQIVHRNVSWQVNDPLVHYTVQDLVDLMGDMKPITYGTNQTGPFTDFAGAPVTQGIPLDPVNAHYRPWGGRPLKSADTTPSTIANYNVKDPLVKSSDDWQFPTNKFPDLGWIGRVHRGTPWQTIDLKAAPTDKPTLDQLWLTWAKWSGHVFTNWYSIPTNDFRVVDLFTTAFNDNASRGQLSVNQTNLPAWSAVLTGCIVNTNMATNSSSFIEPAGVYNPVNTSSYPALVKIVAGINRTRAAQPGGRFQRLGDILQTPELTTASPYIVTNRSSFANDAVYERIPQQILSLLRNDEPRYIVYAFGQALKPAPNSVITSPGNDFGLCTNYQITAEAAARAVVHLEGPANNPHIIVDSYNILPPY
jgi:hypothetical protein